MVPGILPSLLGSLSMGRAYYETHTGFPHSAAMPTSIHTTDPHAHDYHLLICSLDVCFLEMLEMYVDVGS